MEAGVPRSPLPSAVAVSHPQMFCGPGLWEYGVKKKPFLPYPPIPAEKEGALKMMGGGGAPNMVAE